MPAWTEAIQPTGFRNRDEQSNFSGLYGKVQRPYCAQTVRVGGTNQAQSSVILEKCLRVFSARCVLAWYGVENEIALITQKVLVQINPATKQVPSPTLMPYDVRMTYEAARHFVTA
jgi:hypothetical protein